MANRCLNLKWLTVAVVFTANVLFLSHLPQGVMPSRLQTGGLDKLAHVLRYGVITLLFILSLRSAPSLFSASLLFFAILAVGIIDELTQPFVNRTASLADWLADIVGVMSVLLFFHVKRPKAKQLDPQHLLCET